MMRQSRFLMKYQEQGVGRSWDYGQALRHSSSQKYACPEGVRRKWPPYVVKILARSAGYARQIFSSIPAISNSIAAKILPG